MPHPTHFSTYFKIPKEKLNQLGVFDPILNQDTKVFVDPLTLKDCKDDFQKEAFVVFNNFFTTLLKKLMFSKMEGDNAYTQAKRMVKFPEYQYTCIGYAGTSNRGSGAGGKINDIIFEGAREIVNNAKNDSEAFLLLPLFCKGDIGGDRISDMTQSIIDKVICKYTVEVMQKLDLKGNYTYKTTPRTFNDAVYTFNLLKNPFSNCAIKFLPQNILRTLPDFENDIFEAVSFNQELRDAISTHIGLKWHEAKKEMKKEALIDLIKKDKEVFLQVLKAVKEASFEHYDIEKDTEGLYRWLEDSEKFFNAPKIVEGEDTLDSITNTVQSIINHFQNLIENQNLWRIFFTKDNGTVKQVREFYSQMLFYMVCDSWLVSQFSNIKFTKEENKTTKQIDFIFTISNKNIVRVNIKHSNNTKLLDAYEKQMKFLTTEKSTQGLFVVLDFKEKVAPQFVGIKDIEKDLCKITKIEATMQENIGELIEFEEEEGETMQQKGGKNSYQKYKPLKIKVEELCNKELKANKKISALQLCNIVGNIIEAQHSELLQAFYPYQSYLKAEGTDWLKPTFYNWCNAIYKQQIK